MGQEGNLDFGPGSIVLSKILQLQVSRWDADMLLLKVVRGVNSYSSGNMRRSCIYLPHRIVDLLFPEPDF